MFRIERDSLYSMEDLERELGGLGITVRQFLDVVRPPKMFRGVWLGVDILKALDRYGREREAEKNLLPGRRLRGRPRTATVELLPLGKQPRE